MRRFGGLAAAVTIIELVVIVEVAQVLGVVNTIGLLILVSVVGVLIVKAQGIASLRRLLGDVQAGRVPGPALADGALAVAAGVVLIVPGFVTDVAALLLLIPPLRRGVRRRIRQRWAERFVIVRGDELEA